MALIKCSACDKQISDEAEACPHCGQPNREKCPICKSSNVDKIGMGSKVVSWALYGVFAFGEIAKKWECKDCNSKW
ncbi:zinc ribbon domain-containing protein [Clostridium sp.]|uniref:zinc ribbon domain-containing protein n=1 Tax=Clostridium sp. TaxID=1506 RepID=UPI003217C0FA